MEFFFSGMGILICFVVLLTQFYIASKQGCNSTANVVATGSSLTILNRRHAISSAAMAVLLLYIGIVKRDWLLLRASPSVEVVVLTFILGTAAFSVSLAAATREVNKLELPTPVSGSETYLILRALFLILYEFFFRAILFSFCLQFTSVPVAIAINVVLYTIAHLFSTRQELLGTVPFGILLCLVTLYSRCIWPAVLLHLLLGLPYDVLVLAASKFSTKTYIS